MQAQLEAYIKQLKANFEVENGALLETKLEQLKVENGGL